jgi:hypothetical protein
MMTVRQRISVVANLFGIPSRLMLGTSEERETFDVHVFTDSGGRFRLGYFGGNTFFRENPVPRTLRRYGVSVREGRVGEGSEPQYDLRITFNDDGSVRHISDNRASMEAEF